MKRNDYLLMALLVALLFAWPIIDREIIKKKFYHQPSHPAAPAVAAPSTPTAPAEAELAAAPAQDATPVEPAAVAETAETAAAVAEEEPGEEQTVSLSNDKIVLTFSSRGASIKDATLKDYRAALDQASGPMMLDFSSLHALAYEGLPGFGEGNIFSVTADDATRTVTFEKAAGNGLRFRRVMQLNDSYVVTVSDSIVNETLSPITLPASKIQTGPMHRESGQHVSPGFSHLGVDILSPGGHDVRHWGSKVPGFFKAEQEDQNLPKLPVTISRSPNDGAPVDWVAAKNKYFVQIVTPEEGGESAYIHATRDVTPVEKADPEFTPKMTPIAEISASVALPETIIEAGGTMNRNISYYVGPMKYSELRALSLHRVEVMEFGSAPPFGFLNWLIIPVGKALLKTMNFIHNHLWPHNYGLAIILLTLIVRTVFWPITHKSTESMKRMAEMQPLVNQIREKYKDNPQRVQQEIMALYKEHKINPLGGCLPMLIQIPIFIALFMVLRSAIELRFAPFLWIKDLSEPENLFADVIGFPINILPLLMAGTMYLQQKMTPTTGDPAQAKMMRIMMPGMMLFFLYSYASGLALYWTTQNLLMIFQQVTMQQRKKMKAAAGK